MNTPNIMTMKEVSEYLRVSERTVLDWAQKGEIPCGKLCSSWRFKREDIEAWLNERLSSAPAPTYAKIRLELILNPDCIEIIDKPMKKTEALDLLIDKISAQHEIPKATFRQAIFDREELMSTGIGLSIAVPHVRLKNIDDIVMGALIVRDGIDDYEALDGQTVKLVFMIIANDGQHNDYLKFLSALSKQLQCEDYRNELLSVQDSDNLYIKLIKGI
ncbi:MAG: PTS sugar transporter subunit IIA [Lentisphaeraceae bacterium]|nr:PTS sugar transporter subunit IIA [Lentisphaeraceae bacterium]